jgi:hypothetical protein
MILGRQEILELFAQLSEKYPEMRFGQLVTNVAQWAKGPTLSAAWDVTDEELIAAAKKNLGKK